MISICIPIYNYDITQLVNKLYCQAETCGIEFEILAIDDASEEKYRRLNSHILLPHFRYIQLSENIGRSKIRNLLAKEACQPYLIFMDCDSDVADEQYIQRYLSVCKPCIVCCGGTIYNTTPPTDETYLRWLYGIHREALTAAERNKNTNSGFRTHNFLIDKTVFQTVQFNTELEGYGHEDTYWGLELGQKGFSILHIDNPLIHLGLESAEIFLAKTEKSIENLIVINRLLKKNYPQLVNHSRLVYTANTLQRFHLKGIVKILFKLCKQAMKKNLLGKNPKLKIFDLYKLGYLCNLKS